MNGTTPIACMWCHQCYIPLQQRGLLWLCESCMPTKFVPACAVHAWQGSVTPGTWVCLACGALLPPSPPDAPLDAKPTSTLSDY